jgi:hypothetical protein
MTKKPPVSTLALYYIMTEDYYAVLEVTRTADDVEIKASYRRLAMLRHPDKDRGNPNATADFQLVSLRFSGPCGTILRGLIIPYSFVVPTRP